MSADRERERARLLVEMAEVGPGHERVRELQDLVAEEQRAEPWGARVAVLQALFENLQELRHAKVDLDRALERVEEDAAEVRERVEAGAALNVVGLFRSSPPAPAVAGFHRQWAAARSVLLTAERVLGRKLV